MNGRERILAMLAGDTPDHLPFMPFTMMFAADHAGARYLEYCTDERVHAEAQLQVTRAYDIDHVSVTSDPCCEAADCGAAVKYFPDQPAAIDEARPLLSNRETLRALKPPSPSEAPRMRSRLALIERMKREAGAEKLVEGWVEGPCAEAADLRGLNQLMLDFFDAPEFIGEIFEFTLGMALEFGRAQIAAGADLIGVGDAAASLIGPEFYQQFVWPYEKRLIEGLQAAGGRTRLHICGNTRPLLGAMGRLGSDIVDLDSLAPLDEARAQMGAGQVLLGNLDPVRVLRDGTPASVYAAVAACHRQAGARFIVGAGCEVPRDTPPENLRAMARYAREHSSAAARA